MLDAIEGERYDRVAIEVESAQHGVIEAYCYIANTFVDDQLPFDWYVQHVLNGALEHTFPAEYVALIKAQPHVIDHHEERAQREWQLHRPIKITKKA
ncbi:gamma-glutamylcyclotransferase [Pseudoalteromonas sp. T1lg23B]|uniref:gamma-glutamylcyclotransferase n=1 Tax=Pseudoalteromonas sp. T1lg23B TaxID=2077097 RepID=UPI001F46FA5E|nr:gamma-glutamylcyclotransferase [Pseudoalteromonas sp. T1lg23B]